MLPQYNEGQQYKGKIIRSIYMYQGKIIKTYIHVSRKDNQEVSTCIKER